MAEEYKARVGARIREAREAKGLSQAALARLLPGNTDGPSVSRWERGKVMPGTDTLEALGKALEKDVSYFLVAEPLPGSPDLLSAFNGDEGSQLDRIEETLTKLRAAVAALAADNLRLTRALEDLLGRDRREEQGEGDNQ